MLTKLRQTILRGVDPILGFTYDGPEDLVLATDEELSDGLIWIGNRATQGPRVGVLGGSTSDISYSGSWLRPLRVVGQERGRPLSLISGAVSGYASSQELIKLTRDLLPAQPTVVVNLNGVNDLGFIQAGDRSHPSIHSYQLRLFRFLVSVYGGNRGARSLWNKVAARGGMRPPAMNDELKLGGMHLGYPSTATPAAHWYRNVRMCRAVCKEFGVPYVAFLQPIMGIGNYQLNAEEIEYHEGYLKEHPGLHGVPYHEAARTFYEEARKYAAQHPDFMVDLVDVFQGHQGVFADSRHPNERGYRVLAEAIFESLSSRNCI